jgi:hypothetical protein
MDRNIACISTGYQPTSDCYTKLRDTYYATLNRVRDDSDAFQMFISLQGYHINSDEFNYNYGQAKAAVGEYKAAIEVQTTHVTAAFEQWKVLTR